MVVIIWNDMITFRTVIYKKKKTNKNIVRSDKIKDVLIKKKITWKFKWI